MINPINYLLRYPNVDCGTQFIDSSLNILIYLEDKESEFVKMVLLNFRAPSYNIRMIKAPQVNRIVTELDCL